MEKVEKSKYRLGVFVARFQTSMIHAAHAILINYVRSKNDTTFIIIGESQTRLTNKNPLPAEARIAMIEDMYYDDRSNLKVYSLKDEKYDDAWSKNLDEIIEGHIRTYNFFKDGQFFRSPDEVEVTMYCGRDGFKQYYSGKFKVEEIDSLGIDHISATEMRKQIQSRIKNSVEWREGVIYASAHRYPTSYQTVDVAILKKEESGKIKLLLGKKKHEKCYRFIGGFVDVKDKTLEDAAMREVKEEVGLIRTENYKYITSMRVDDWRYRKENDSIMTAFFCCDFVLGKPIANDDIHELAWFELDTSKEFNIPIEDEHKPLMTALLKHLWDII